MTPSGASQRRSVRPAVPANGSATSTSIEPGRLSDEQVALAGARPEDRRRRHGAAAQAAAGDPRAQRFDRPHGLRGVLRHNPPMLRPVLPLETVPNFSEGRDPRTLDALGEALESGGARVLDVHVDVDHNRSVFTTCGSAGGLRHGLIAAAAVAMEQIDVRANDGVHPHIGALDIVPGRAARRRAARARAAPRRRARRRSRRARDCPSSCTPTRVADAGPHEFRRGGLDVAHRAHGVGLAARRCGSGSAARRAPARSCSACARRCSPST